MKFDSRRFFIGLVILAAGGCGSDSPAGAQIDKEAEVWAGLAQLAPEDRRLVEDQRFCPLMRTIRLGEMGPPHKVTVKGVTVFVCCEGCVRQAEADPDGCLAKIRRFEEARAKERALAAPK
jgi:hypothetical protein